MRLKHPLVLKAHTSGGFRFSGTQCDKAIQEIRAMQNEAMSLSCQNTKPYINYRRGSAVHLSKMIEPRNEYGKNCIYTLHKAIGTEPRAKCDTRRVLSIDITFTHVPVTILQQG